MSTKNDPSASASTASAERLRDDLAPLGDIRIRKMFGGYGVFETETMFALVDKNGGVFFKADESNVKQFEEAGSKKHGRMPYYRLPQPVLADEQQLIKWAQASIAVARKSK